MNKGFYLEISSNKNYEGMVVEVSYDNYLIAEINYDKGINNLEIEFIPPAEEFSDKYFLPLDEFLIILNKAKLLALKCAKEDEIRKKEQQ